MSKTQKTAARRGIGYVRVSRKGKRGGDSYHTEEMQKAQIAAYAAAKRIKIVRWIYDINQSGKNAKRPGLMEALDLLDAGGADTLIVAKLSRFARSTKDALTILDRLESDPHPASLVACDVDVDTSTPVGRLLRTILSAVAEFELELAAERWSEVQEKAVEDGIYIKKAPPGYQKTARRKLVVDPEVAPVVRALFRDRAEGYSWAELLERWQKAGGPKISRNGLQTIIGNRAYLGETRVNGWVMTHDALVSQEEFDAAQAVKSPQRWRSREGSLLAGLLTCSVTGAPMTNAGVDKRGRRSYRCQPNGPCKGHRQTVSQEYVDQIVSEELLAWSADHVRELEGTSAQESDLVAAERRVDALEAELISYAESADVLDGAIFKAGAAKRQAKLDEARDVVAALRSERKVETVRVSLAGIWPDLSTEERRRLVAAAIERVEVHPSESHRVLHFANVTEEERLAAVRDRLRITFRADAG